MDKIIFITLHQEESELTEICLNVARIVGFERANAVHSLLYLEGYSTPFMVWESPDEIMDILMNISNTL